MSSALREKFNLSATLAAPAYMPDTNIRICLMAVNQI